MAIITYDENGNEIDILAEMNEKIISDLETAFRTLLDEKDGDRNGKKRLGNRMMMQINNVLNKQPRMTAQQFVSLDADDIYRYWNAYYDLMCHYNLYFEIVPNRQSFLKYSGLNSRQYEQLQDHQDEEIRAAIIFIEDSLKQDGFSAGENGNADAKAIGVRLSARKDGHSVISAGEEMIAATMSQVPTPLELERKFKQLFPGGAK